MRGARPLLLAGSLAVLAGCATRPAVVAPVRAPEAVQPAPVPVPSPADYLAAAASIDLYVVRACELALSVSRDARTRALAERLLVDHRGLASQLSFAGRRLNLLPPARLLPREAERLSWLRSHPEFDKAFQRQSMLTHEQSVALHASFAEGGSSPTLRLVAAHARTVEQAHAAELKALSSR